MNPFGFLGNLGGAIGGGAKNLGGMFAKGFKKIGEMEGGAEGPMLKPPMPRTGPGGTGGFAGNEGLPQIGGQRGLINRPEPMPSTMPQLQRPEMPKLEPIRDGASVSANLPMGDAEASPLSGQMIAERPVPTVRPPDFLGRKGATMDDTPLNHERYAYDNQYMQDGHHPRRWQDIAMTALHGANQGFQSTGDWRGALGGAGVGAAGAAINPLMARDYRFNQEQLPRITASRQEAERGQDRNFELQKRDADLSGSRARTAATIAGMKDPELERRKTEAMISKANAQAEAARTGKPQRFIEYNPETDQYLQGWKYPDGREDFSGQAGSMEIKREGFENQKQIGDARNKAGMDRVIQQGKDAFKRTQVQQGGANWRTTYSQSKQDDRTDKRIKAQYGDAPPVGSVPFQPPVKPPGGTSTPKTATKDHIAQYAKQNGISYAEAQRIAESKGYSVR